MYNPDNQYRCTIIRGKSQVDMENLLSLYANIVDRTCPCALELFRTEGFKMLSKALFNTEDYGNLSTSNQKTVQNHLTEVAGSLLGLYYPYTDPDTGTVYVRKSAACQFLIDSNDYPTFFKNLCLNFQFPNGSKSKKYIEEDFAHGVHIKPFCYVVKLLHHAQNREDKMVLTKQEIGYYVLNNLDVLRGEVSVETVCDRIAKDRKNGITKDKLTGSRDWQHIKEQFNLLELADIIECDSTYVWLNHAETESIAMFIDHLEEPFFEYNSDDLDSAVGKTAYIEQWKQYYGKFNEQLAKISAPATIASASQGGAEAVLGMHKSTTDLGNEGEALVLRLEQERVRAYKARLVNKVLLLGNIKGLGYDISSIEADEDAEHPEFARYIEVKSTRRITEPTFDAEWSDSMNLTAKEWIAAQQYGEHYNVYRVYFTKNKTIVVRVKDPYRLSQEQRIDVYPTVYQMNIDASVIEKRYVDAHA